MKLNRTPSIHDRKWRNEENHNWNIIEAFLEKFDGNQLLEVSDNLFNKNDTVEGILSRGEVIENSLYVSSGYIKMTPDTLIRIQSTGANSGSAYDENFNYIDGFSQSRTDPSMTPKGTAWVRVSFRKDSLHDAMFYTGAAVKPYETFGVTYSDKIYDTDFINDIQELVEGLGSGRLEIYDQTLNKANTYVSYTNGVEASSNSWSATTNIPITPGTIYLKNAQGQTAFYDSENRYVGGLTNRTSNLLFNTPQNASTVKFSIPKGKESGFKLTRLENVRTSPVKGIFQELLNPFKLSYVKMIGDSNVAGSGGTGYNVSNTSADKAPGFSDRYMNENGYCWANELKKLLIEKFNGTQVVGLNHHEVKTIQRSPVTSYDSNAISSYSVEINSDSPVEFSFYGDSLSLFTSQSTGSIEVRIDGSVVKTISSFNNQNEEHIFSGINLGTHKVEITATSGTVYFTGIKLRKRTISKNYGVSGVGTDYVVKQINSLLDGTETIVLCLVGSNDRIPNANADYLSELVENYKMIYLSILNSGAQPVFLSSTPASVGNETSLTRDFDKGDVDTATSIASAFFGYEHISVYNYILEYSELTGTPIDSLLADGVHPNDEGYRLAFNYICKEIGIGRKRPDATW